MGISFRAFYSPYPNLYNTKYTDQYINQYQILMWFNLELG